VRHEVENTSNLAFKIHHIGIHNVPRCQKDAVLLHRLVKLLMMI
jgi:hypothetical protein